ncbi:MAG: AbrB/MazE/SpoVT family DNA-binding domain-containing protein [Clostridia bacterium]|nr:AbrB/MazE/SpoVT family DNA-binding domain-containing protein [Clostridia bacterium]
MKATGIVRRIDDLGRVVIPKEIRRTMRIREGDPLEIFTDRDGEVIFKKYSPIGELSELAVTYCDVLVKSTEQTVIICDRDHCIAAAGIPKKEVLERRVTTTLEDVMEGRRIYTSDANRNDSFLALEGVNRPVTIAAPIISAGDIAGVVVFLGDDETTMPSPSDIKLATVAAGFLGKNMEEF